MQHYSILIACDQKYYNDWGETLLKSINFNCPDLKLRCHIINPNNLKKLNFVEYTTESISFDNEESKISYLQCARFLAVSKIPTTECVLTLDADTICCRKFTINEFIELFNKQNILVKEKKPDRWLCGFVCFRNDNFRNEYAEIINSEPIINWKFGRDQQVLSKFKDKFKFVPVHYKWMSIGKNGRGSIFLTLKGDQKTTNKYLKIYKTFKKEIGS